MLYSLQRESHSEGLASPSCLWNDWGKRRDRRPEPTVTRLFIVLFPSAGPRPPHSASLMEKWYKRAKWCFGQTLPSILPGRTKGSETSWTSQSSGWGLEPYVPIPAPLDGKRRSRTSLSRSFVEFSSLCLPPLWFLVLLSALCLLLFITPGTITLFFF